MSYLEKIFESELKQNCIIAEPFDIKNYDSSYYCYSEFRLFALIVGKDKGMQKRLKDLGLNDILRFKNEDTKTNIEYIKKAINKPRAIKNFQLISA